MPQHAESIVNDLIKKINLLKNSQQRDDLAVRRLKNQVKQLKNSQPDRAYMLLGMLAVIEYKVTEVHAHFQRAKQLAPNDKLISQNYINALANLGLFNAALDTTKQLLEHSPAELEIIELAIKNACSACRLLEAADFLQKWQQLAQQTHAYAITIDNGILLYKNTGLTDAQAAAMQIQAFNLLETNNVRFIHSKMLQINQQTIEYIIYDIFVQAEKATIKQLNRQLAQLQSENVQKNHNYLVFAYQNPDYFEIKLELETLEGFCFIKSFDDRTIYFKPYNQDIEIICCYNEDLRSNIYEILMQPVQMQALVRRSIDDDEIINIHMYTVQRIAQCDCESWQSAAWHWQPNQSFEQLAAAQGVHPVTTPSTLLGGWPTEDVKDAFEIQVRQWRCEQKP